VPVTWAPSPVLFVDVNETRVMPLLSLWKSADDHPIPLFDTARHAMKVMELLLPVVSPDGEMLQRKAAVWVFVTLTSRTVLRPAS
jgi:hypothetical protein